VWLKAELTSASQPNNRLSPIQRIGSACMILQHGHVETPLQHGAPPQCQVLSGFSGIVVQALLFGVSVGSLLTKWWLEKPRRRFRIFFLDSSKQFLGAGVIHCLNLVCAVTFSHLQASAADECA